MLQPEHTEPVQHLEPLPKGTCPECQRKMIKRKEKYVCFTCKLEMEFKE